MADLSKIKLNGITYNLKDATVPSWAKQASAPIISVNNATGAIVVDKIKTTAGDNTTEYNLVGTQTNNNNTSAVLLYNPTLLSFAKYTNNFARLTLGDSSTPGDVRLYSNQGGYTDIKVTAANATIREITFPDANGTVALTSDIPSVPSWALASNKPIYTASEVGAITSNETSQMIASAVGNITSFSTEVV